MRITRLDAWLVSLRLAEPYTVAYERVDRAPNIFLRIETDKKLFGIGSMNPDEPVCGETPATVLTAVDGPARDALIGSDPRFVTRLRERLRKLLPAAPGARAGIDMALYDMLGKIAGLPVYQLLGAYRDRIATSVTIGILDEEETVKRALDLTKQGFRALKLNGGLDVDDDITRVPAVRDSVGNKIALRFDANQGYDVTDSLRIIAAAKRAKLELVEQPTPRDALDELAKVTRKAALPIMADESALGIAGALHFALAHPAVQYADLDGHLDLIDDPAAGAVILKNGMLMPGVLSDLRDC